MKDYKFLFRNGDTQIKVSVKAENQDQARGIITYLLNAPEKFDFTLVEVSERIKVVPTKESILRTKIYQSNVVYLDGKTIKDRYKPEDVQGVHIFEILNILEIESWDEENKILKLITTNKFEGE
jgi:hypothetical protein